MLFQVILLYYVEDGGGKSSAVEDVYRLGRIACVSYLALNVVNCALLFPGSPELDAILDYSCPVTYSFFVARPSLQNQPLFDVMTVRGRNKEEIIMLVSSGQIPILPAHAFSSSTIPKRGGKQMQEYYTAQCCAV